MTDEEAREVLQEQIDKYGQEYDEKGIEALNVAIKALQQQPCEDCISREDVINIIEDVCPIYENDYRYILKDKIAQLPSVTPSYNSIKTELKQPSEDAISRKEALRHRHIIHDDDGVGYSVVRVDEIEQLPSVTPQQARWISVSERLPEEDGTLRGYLVNVGYWVGIAHFVNGEFWQSYAPEKMRFDYPVKAWMPLPTPYAESDKEEEE